MFHVKQKTRPRPGFLLSLTDDYLFFVSAGTFSVATPLSKIRGYKQIVDASNVAF